jgi:hypothetical protein
MQLMPGVPELCAYLDQKRIPRGLITRNVKASVDWLHKNHLAPLHSLTGQTGCAAFAVLWHGTTSL